MEHPTQHAGVDKVLQCAENDLAAFQRAVENDDVAALRSMLRAMDPHYDAACIRYVVPKKGASKAAQAAAALEAKAREVAAGMDLCVDKNGRLVTTVKAVSDEEMQSLGLWLPPVGFDECNGDIFKVGKVGRAVEGFLASADSAYESYVKKQLGVQGAGTFSTNLLPDKPLVSKQEGRWNPRRGRPRGAPHGGSGAPHGRPASSGPSCGKSEPYPPSGDEESIWRRPPW